MIESMKIESTCRVAANKVWLNEKLIFTDDESQSLQGFLKNLYKHLGISYPKFFKMDNLSKLAFLSAEIIINNTPAFNDYDSSEKGMFFANSQSSLDTDFKYFDTIKDAENYFPSPALFVYTLPNLTIGELAIRHQITGEGCFFVSEKHNKIFMQNYIQQLFNETLISIALAGWVDVLGDDCEVFLEMYKKS